MDQNTLSGVIAALLQQAGRAVERGAELAPEALDTAGRYLQFLAIANLAVGLLLLVFAIIAVFFFKKGFDINYRAQEQYRKNEEDDMDYYERRSKKERDEVKSLVMIFASAVAAVLFFIASMIQIAEPKTWASAFDHRAALVGYVLEAAKPSNRR